MRIAAAQVARTCQNAQDGGTDAPASGRRPEPARQPHRVDAHRGRVPAACAQGLCRRRQKGQCKCFSVGNLSLSDVQVLYGLPIPHGALERLAAIAKALGKDSVSILLDDPAQIPVAAKLKSLSGVVPLAHIKVDMGGRRAGVEVESERFAQLADAALAAHGRGDIVLLGLYSHAGHSYGGDSRAAAMKMMRAELDAMVAGADKLLAKDANLPPLTVSAGASPTTLSVQNLLASNDSSVPAEVRAEVDALTQLLASIRNKGHDVEIHAGVYPTLDLQQLAAHSMAASRLSWGDIALTILAEVHSQYPGRGANGTDEALIGAGGLALARETCKAYEGMAMMTPWGRGTKLPECDVEDFSGWVVGRFSQEHGILTWRGDGPADKTPQVGERVKLWPNHACITSSHFGWYFVTDSDGQEDVITDVWVKARGW